MKPPACESSAGGPALGRRGGLLNTHRGHRGPTDTHADAQKDTRVPARQSQHKPRVIPPGIEQGLADDAALVLIYLGTRYFSARAFSRAALLGRSAHGGHFARTAVRGRKREADEDRAQQRSSWNRLVELLNLQVQQRGQQLCKNKIKIYIVW